MPTLQSPHQEDNDSADTGNNAQEETNAGITNGIPVVGYHTHLCAITRVGCEPQRVKKICAEDHREGELKILKEVSIANG